MYAAKRGQQGFEVWAPSTPASATGWSSWAAARRALDGRRTRQHYQPKLDLRSGRIVGVEALVRWNHPERGRLSPDVFLPLAEQAGLMRRLAAGVLDRALRDLAAWRRGRDD